MDCPFCKKELESGFLHSNSQIFYARENRRSGAACYPEKGDLKLSTFWSAALPVLRCPDCQIICLSTQFRDKK